MTLTDSVGREWPLFINAACIDRIYEATGVDVSTVEGVALCGQNEVLAIDVMYAAWRPLCEQRGIGRVNYHRLDKQFLWRAAKVFLISVADYHARGGGRDVAKILKRAVRDGSPVDPVSRQTLRDKYEMRANELTGLNSERAIDEKLAELHELLGKTQGRGEL